MSTPKIYPAKLAPGDEVRVIAPSRSLALIAAGQREIANRRFAEMGLRLTFGRHVEEADEFSSSSIASRVEDFNDAFRNGSVRGVITVIGGFNCNQLLRHLDWDLVRKNPKVFCGFSDITALNNALYAKTGLVSYSGPHYSTFAQELHADYMIEYFKKCLFAEAPYDIEPSPAWSDDLWWMDQRARNMMPNPGFLVINAGAATGTLLGGNLCTFNLLQGTEFFPGLRDSILFLEDDCESQPQHFDRDLQSLIHLPDFKGVRGLVFGKFQKASKMTDEKLVKIVQTKKELAGLPVVANVDFGHIDPKITFPVGGWVNLRAGKDDVLLEILEH